MWSTTALLVAAYLLGGLSPGWWLVYRKTGADLRTQGSGVTGATNAARVLGLRWFVIVLALDAAKGAAAVGATRWLVPGATWGSLALPAVVAGHIWPIWLGYRGGRGAGPLLGGVLALAWPAGVGAMALGLAAGGLARKKFVAGATAYVASGPLVWWFVPDPAGRVSFGLAWLLVLLAHRDHFAQPKC
jgi:glycerol-3-phosphate acyltransferase PlsY